jgi:predicted HAD superfamily phosphohydrolase
MGQAIAVGRDFTSEEIRQLAKRAKDSSQARRLLAIAAVLDGASRQDAAKAGAALGPLGSCCISRAKSGVAAAFNGNYYAVSERDFCRAARRGGLVSSP